MGLVALLRVGSSWTRHQTCVLLWRADFSPLSHQGSPSTIIYHYGWDLLGTNCVPDADVGVHLHISFYSHHDTRRWGYYYINYRKEKTVWISQVACSAQQLVGAKNKLNSCYLTPNYLNSCYSDNVPPLGWNIISVWYIDWHILSYKWYSFA